MKQLKLEKKKKENQKFQIFWTPNLYYVNHWIYYSYFPSVILFCNLESFSLHLHLGKNLQCASPSWQSKQNDNSFPLNPNSLVLYSYKKKQNSGPSYFLYFPSSELSASTFFR